MSVQIAILIPTKNRKSLLERSLLSALSQKTRAREIIIVNEASTDGTKEWLDGLKEENLKVINREKSGGVNSARNLGVREAESEWIAWLDDDDELLVDAVEKMQTRLAEVPANCQVVFFNTTISQTDKLFEGGYQFKPGQEFVDLSYEDWMLIKQNLRGDAKPVVRRKLHTERGFWLPESVNGFESYFFAEAALAGVGIRCYREVTTLIHQEASVGDRLSLGASAKRPWPLLLLHFKQLGQHHSFYLSHPHLLAKKVNDMAKLFLRSAYQALSPSPKR